LLEGKGVVGRAEDAPAAIGSSGRALPPAFELVEALCFALLGGVTAALSAGTSINFTGISASGLVCTGCFTIVSQEFSKTKNTAPCSSSDIAGKSIRW
jgi:Na+-driven multidrug efflux pump